MLKSILVILVALVCASPALAKDHVFKDKDGGTITVSGEIQYLDEKGKPKGPKVDMPLAGMTVAGDPATPVARVARSSAASGCATGYATVTKNSFLGWRIWQAWHWVNWCWQYPRVTSVRRWTDGKGSNGWSYDGATGIGSPTFFQWCCGSPQSGHRRTFRYAFHIPAGPSQQTAYPTIRVEVHGNGTAWQASTS